MQARSLALLRTNGLTRKALAKEIGRSVSAVTQALNASPAKNSDTLKDIFNYFHPSTSESSLAQRARQLAHQAPETAALLSAVFRDLADLLVGASNAQGVRPGKPRS